MILTHQANIWYSAQKYLYNTAVRYFPLGSHYVQNYLNYQKTTYLLNVVQQRLTRT